MEDVTVAHLREFLVHTQQRPASSVNPRRPGELDGHTPSTATMQGYVKAIKVLFAGSWMRRSSSKTQRRGCRSPSARSGSGSASRTNICKPALWGLRSGDAAGLSRLHRSCWCCWTLASASRSSAELTLDDVHDGYLTIIGKGRKEREVGVTPTTAKFLWKYVNLHRRGGE